MDYTFFYAISHHAEIVLAQVSIWWPKFIVPPGEMSLIARGVGVSLLDYFAENFCRDRGTLVVTKGTSPK